MDRLATPGASRDVDVRLGQLWREHHRYLLDVAFRVLGSISEAEDAVQEGFARLVDVDLDEIDDVRGWMVVVVSRLCFDQLRSARWKRQTPATADLERRADAGADPVDRITLDDEVRLALHVVIARLTPAERTAFVLHDVFGYSFDDVGTVVGRSPAACRQLAARARKRIRADGRAGRSPMVSAEQRRVADQFVTACATGDLDGLLAVLDPDVAGEGEGGGAGPVVGRDAVARVALRFNGPRSPNTLLSLPTGTEPTVLVVRAGRIVGTLTLTVGDGRITHVHGVFDPAKLTDLNEILGS